MTALFGEEIDNMMHVLKVCFLDVCQCQSPSPCSVVGQLQAARVANQKPLSLQTEGMQAGQQGTAVTLPRNAVALIRLASELSQKIMNVQGEMSSARLRCGARTACGMNA